MIRRITVKNEDEKELVIYPNKKWRIVDIDGISPGNAEMYFTEKGATDGAIYNGSRRPSREINISLKLKGEIETNRHELYKFFTRKKNVKLFFTTDERSWYCSGVVQKHDTPIFTKTETATITIKCKDPNLYKIGKEKAVFSNIISNFYFPFAIDSEGIELSTITAETENVISYEGDVDVGIIVRVHALGAVSGFALFNSITGGSIVVDDTKLSKIIGTSGLIKGDDLVISTQIGNKYIHVIREGITYNCLNAINKNPEWFQLEIGDNLFYYEAESGVSNIQLQIEYQTAYDGV